MRLAATLILILLFAACSPEIPTPTATPTAEATATIAADSDQLSVLSLTIAVPIPGTLILGNSNVPPGGRPALEFDTVYFTRTGGIAGQQLLIELRRDGTLIRDGESSTVPDATVADVDNRLNLIDFYGLQGIFTGPVAPDAFIYNLTVESNVGSRTISAQDGFTPPELIDLFSFFAALGT
jgi:hypothetical protein